MNNIEFWNEMKKPVINARKIAQELTKRIDVNFVQETDLLLESTSITEDLVLSNLERVALEVKKIKSPVYMSELYLSYGVGETGDYFYATVCLMHL
jgi:hypothetical protein